MLKKDQLYYFRLVIIYIVLYPLIIGYIAKHMSVKSNYLFYFCNISNKEHSLSSKLAFTLSPFTKPKFTSQEIIINGLNSDALKRKLMSYFAIQTDSRKIYDLQQVKKWIKQMKFSGFFTHVEVSISSVDNHQIVQIDLTPNPILQAVKLIDCSQKLVPYSYLLFLFRSQLGYPMNFLQLNNSIRLITQWYHSRGYQWAEVKIVQSQPVMSSAIIYISEGIITKIDIIGYNQQYQYINLQRILPTSLVLETLKIKPLQILNLRDLDQGIINLKKRKIFLQCHYEIIKSVNYNNQLQIILNLEVLNDRSTYFFGKKLSIASSVLESIELLFQYSLDHLRYHYIPTESIIRNVRRIGSNLNSNNINISNFLYLSMPKTDNIVYPLLYINKQKRSCKIHEWYLTQLIFTTVDSFGFRHYMRNLSQGNGNCIIDACFDSTAPYLNLKYKQSWVSECEKTPSQANLRFFRDTYTYSSQHLPVLLDQLSNSILYHKNFLVIKNGLSFKLHKDISSKISTIEKVSLKSITSKYIYLHNNVRWNQIAFFSDIPSLTKIYSHFRQLWIYSVEELTQFQFNIKYSDFINYFNSKHFCLKSVHFIPTTNSIFSAYECRKLNYSNKIMLNFKQSFNINSGHIFTQKVKIMILMGSKYHLPFSEEFLLIGPDIIRGYGEGTFPFPMKFGKINLEYHVPVKDKNTLFLFIDYAQNITIFNLLNKYKILLSQFSPYTYTNFSKRLSYGIGLQIKIPIKQIPPLRLEYAYNIHNGQSLHIRIYKQ